MEAILAHHRHTDASIGRFKAMLRRGRRRHAYESDTRMDKAATRDSRSEEV